MRAFGCLVLLAILASSPNACDAHAFLDHATPAVGSAIHASPAQVRLWFTEELEPAFSTIKVLSADGRQIDRQDKQVDRSNPALLQVSVPPLEPGRYRVVWRALSVDTHVTEGDFTFDVQP
jgi:copper resistance protein C